MKKNTKNTLYLVGAAALLFYFWWKNKNKATTLQQKQSEIAPGAPQTLEEQPDLNYDIIKSQTVNFPQIAPTPSTIMDMPKSANNYYQDACGCGCQNNQIGKLPFIC